MMVNRKRTMGQIRQEPKCKYWATRTAHSFACSALLASLVRSAALCCAHLFTYSLTPELMGKWMIRCWVNRLFCTIVHLHLLFFHLFFIFFLFFCCASAFLFASNSITVQKPLDNTSFLLSFGYHLHFYFLLLPVFLHSF